MYRLIISNYMGSKFIAFGQVEFKRDLRERLGGEEGISAVTPEMDNKLKVNAVEQLDLIILISMSALLSALLSAKIGSVRRC